MFQAYLVPIEKRSRHVWSPMWLTFQAYPVPIFIEVPHILGPKFDQRSRHTWPPLLSMFQTYLVPIITHVPCIPSPPPYQIWSEMNVFCRKGIWKFENVALIPSSHIYLVDPIMKNVAIIPRPPLLLPYLSACKNKRCSRVFNELMAKKVISQTPYMGYLQNRTLHKLLKLGLFFLLFILLLLCF